MLPHACKVELGRYAEAVSKALLDREAAVERTQHLTGPESSTAVHADRLNHFLDLNLISSRSPPPAVEAIPVDSPGGAVHAVLKFEDPLVNNHIIQSK